MKENWKDVIGYEELYQVYNLGIIKSLGGSRIRSNGRKQTFSEKIMKFNVDKDGYFRVNLTKNKKGKVFGVHRLVAQAFIPNPENKPCVNHKSGNKKDNSVDNLEFCTVAENNNHAIKTGLRDHRYCMGEKQHMSKLTKEQIKEIKWLLKNSNLKQREIAEIFNISQQNVSVIKLNKNWKHII